MNYTPLHAFAEKHRVPYNELCAAVRDAGIGATAPEGAEEVFKAMDALFKPLAKEGWTLAMFHKDGQRAMQSWWAEEYGSGLVVKDGSKITITPEPKFLV